jgi:hypothetical protein
MYYQINSTKWLTDLETRNLEVHSNSMELNTTREATR